MVVMATRHPDRQPLARRKPWPLPSFTSPGFMTLTSSRPPSLVLAEPLEGQDSICHIMRRVWLLLALKNKSHLCLIRPRLMSGFSFFFFLLLSCKSVLVKGTLSGCLGSEASCAMGRLCCLCVCGVPLPGRARAALSASIVGASVPVSFSLGAF